MEINLTLHDRWFFDAVRTLADRETASILLDRFSVQLKQLRSGANFEFNYISCNGREIKQVVDSWASRRAIKEAIAELAKKAIDEYINSLSTE